MTQYYKNYQERLHYISARTHALLAKERNENEMGSYNKDIFRKLNFQHKDCETFTLKKREIETKINCHR